MAVQQGDGPRPQRQRRVGLQQQHGGGHGAGRSADYGDARGAGAIEIVPRRIQPAGLEEIVREHQPVAGHLVERLVANPGASHGFRALEAAGGQHYPFREQLAGKALRIAQGGAPQAVAGALGELGIVMGEHGAAGALDNFAQALAGCRQQRPGIGQRRAQRPDRARHAPPGGLVGNGGDLGVAIVLHRAEEGFGGGV